MNYFLKKKKWLAWVIMLTFLFTSFMPSNIMAGNSVAEAAISGDKTVAVGEQITLTSDKWGSWSSSNPDIATVSDIAYGKTVEVTGKAPGAVTITHTYWDGRDDDWQTETYVITVTGKNGEYALYCYTLVPGMDLNSGAAVDEMWNGMGVGTFSGAGAPSQYENGVNVMGIGTITYPVSYPQITVQGRLYQYAETGSENATKEGYYTIVWIRVVNSDGANAGNNMHNPTVPSGTSTYHLDGQIFINEEDLCDVTFRIKELGSTEYVIQEKYSRIVSSGYEENKLTRPDTDDIVYNGLTYKFDGWYYDEACTRKADFDSTITTDTNYYGKYVPEFRLSADGYQGEYDGQTHYPTVSAPDGAILEYSADGGTTWSIEPPSITDVGEQEYQVRATVDGASKTASFTLKVTPKTVTFTGESDTKPYTGSEQKLTNITAVVGLLEGHTWDGMTYVAKGINVGNHKGKFIGMPIIKDSAGNDVTNNYYVSRQPGTLTITQATPEEELAATSYNDVYDAQAHGISVSGTVTGDVVYYSFVGGEEATDWTTTAPTRTDVQTEEKVYVKAENPNYVTRYAEASITITPKAVTVKADDKSKVYGENDPTLTATVTGTLNEDPIAYTLSRESGEEVGTYTITPSGEATQGNYSVTYETGTLTITQATPEEELAATSYNDVYDAQAHGISVSGTVTGDVVYYSFVGGEEATDWTTTAPTRTDVQTEEKVYVKAENPNYVTRYAEASITITPKAVTVKADDKSKVYGENDPTLTATVTGTLNEDPIAYTLSRESGEEVGTYTITPSGEATQGNYSVTYETGTLTITQATPEEELAATSYNDVYDAQAHGISVSGTVTGDVVYYSFVGGEEATDWTTTAPTRTDVQTEEKVYVKAENPNYVTRYAEASITITPKAVT
ncbi:MAG: MBG domain-containing protein, partial [Peptococcaceae bacterium]